MSVRRKLTKLQAIMLKFASLLDEKANRSLSSTSIFVFHRWTGNRLANVTGVNDMSVRRKLTMLQAMSAETFHN